MKDKYKIIGPVYDLLSALYSGKSIHNCKVAMFDAENMKAGDEILIAGVGHGRDAINAAEKGANVTVVDISATMLDKFKVLLDKHPRKDLNIRIIHSDIFKFDEVGQYDMVVANFFLNVFDENTMLSVLRHLITLGKDNARIVVGDFSLPSGHVIKRGFQRAYWWVANFVFLVFAKNAWHKIYDYPEHLQKLGLTIKDKKRFKLLAMDCYWSILAQKQA